MKRETNERIRVKVAIDPGDAELVEMLDRIAQHRGISRSRLCEELLLKARGRASFCRKSVTRLVRSKASKGDR